MNDSSVFEEELRGRSGGTCELCGGAEGLTVFDVPRPGSDASADHCIYACATCAEQASGTVDLDAKHWFCLREAVWSEVTAVQVVGYRILKRLEGEGWALDLLGQIYMEEDVQAWADAVAASDAGDGDRVITLDCNGAELADGDSVTLIKDLEVKGGGFTAKRGTMVRGIRLIDDPENIEGRVNKITLVLKTKFLKRVS